MGSAVLQRTTAERIRRWLRPPRRLKFTRQGRWFVAITLLLGIGAINTGNNLLYMLLGMLLGLIIVSGIMSESMIRKVTIERLPGPPLFSGTEGAVQYRLTNQKLFVPSFSIEVVEGEDRETKEWRQALEGKNSRKKKKKKAGDTRDPALPRCLVHRVPAGMERTQRGSVTPPRRGLYRYEHIDLVTRFPFGFFEKSKRLEQKGERLVFPRMVDPPRLDTGQSRLDGAEEDPKKGLGYEFFALRDYQTGEDWRRIHWKVSARRGDLIVRETERELSQTVSVGVYNVLTKEAGRAEERAMERLIEAAAALAKKLISDGCEVGLTSVDGVVTPGVGSAQLNQILRALALLEVHRDNSSRMVPSGPSNRTCLMLHLDSGSPALHTHPSMFPVGLNGGGKPVPT